MAVKLNSSDKKRTDFKKTCEQLEVKYYKWPLDTPTRWNSTCDFLEKGIKLKSAIQLFLSLDNDMKAYRLDDASWSMIEKTFGFLKVIALLT